MDEVFADKAEWKTLFASSNFFHRYKYALSNNLNFVTIFLLFLF